MPFGSVLTRQKADLPLDLFEAMDDLKRKKNAVILAHYYQDPDIQDVADVLGDSLALARAAQKTRADVIVFCGVHFMAETAKILNPERTVLLPDLSAGCSLADSCPPAAFEAFCRAHPDHFVVSYINCSAEVKALSDVICTSSNAEAIIRQIPADRPVIFAPDRNLGRYLVRKTGRKMLLWEGSCIVHEAFSLQKIRDLKAAHPAAKLLAHPECEEPVLMMADFIGSTTGILKYVQGHSDRSFIIATETNIIHQMKKACPDKEFIPAPSAADCNCNLCPHMAVNTMEKLYLCLRDGAPEIRMDESLRLRALGPLERMLDMSRAIAPVAVAG
ncbi:MAG: quinolinate synthase [Candidatus Lindowbacteria bacterium RIFCSPLOWO2_12_FULL_62_27]|nr:MAG: quinolinate synthase [Candidatus Lindowbacteria bacterium RIFCSPLOWO2_12_FULL_62_27]